MSIYSRIEQVQVRSSREYLDQLDSGILAQSGVDLQSDLNHLFSSVRRIIYGNASGVGKWYDSVPSSLTTLDNASGILSSRIDTNESNISTNASNISSNTSAISSNSSSISSLQTDVGNIDSFIGRGVGESLPTYSSSVYVSQSGSLEQAIGELDNAIATAGVGAETWTEVFNNGSGLLDASTYNADITLGSSTSFIIRDSSGNALYEINDSENSVRSMGRRERLKLGSNIPGGTTVTLPGGIAYTPDSQFRNLQIFRNGALLTPGSGVVSTDEDFGWYRELNSTQIVLNFTLKSGEIIDVKSFG